jgi:hypothetical protein
LIESPRPLPARPFCGVDRLTFSFLNRSLVSTAILTQAGIFLKSTVAVTAASMRALRLFERAIARRSAAASASERGPSPREEDSSDANVECDY